MIREDKVLQFAGKIRQLGSTLREISVKLEDSEIATTFFNGFPDCFDNLISALDTVYIVEGKL